MRYFLVGWALLVLAVIALAGFRGDTTRQRQLELFPDMDRQPKLRPQEPNRFFANRMSSQPPVEGTVARSEPLQGLREGARIYRHDLAAANTGVIPGTTNWVEVTPFAITPEFMERGRDRYQIFCLPCHGPTGDGDWITRRFGMTVVANLHDQRLVEMADGEIFHVITQGRSLMGAYDDKLDVVDRWAVIAYVRALQLSRLGRIEDLPPDQQQQLQR